MKRFGVLVVCLVALTACGKSSSGKAATTTTAGASAEPEFIITSFGPSGSNIGVDFQINNTTAKEFRFEWAKYVLTAPDGSTHTAYRDPASAPYELIPPGNSNAGGGNFQFDTFKPGHYKIAYDGKVLAEKDL